jgi:hypothetical protein
MPNHLVFYHTPVKIAGSFSDHQGDLTKEFEPEKINLLCKSYVYTGANSVGNFGKQHLNNTRVTEVAKRHLDNSVLSPLLTIRKNVKREENKYGSGGNHS